MVTSGRPAVSNADWQAFDEFVDRHAIPDDIRTGLGVTYEILDACLEMPGYGHILPPLITPNPVPVWLELRKLRRAAAKDIVPLLPEFEAANSSREAVEIAGMVGLTAIGVSLQIADTVMELLDHALDLYSRNVFLNQPPPYGSSADFAFHVDKFLSSTHVGRFNFKDARALRTRMCSEVLAVVAHRQGVKPEGPSDDDILNEYCDHLSPQNRRVLRLLWRSKRRVSYRTVADECCKAGVADEAGYKAVKRTRDAVFTCPVLTKYPVDIDSNKVGALLIKEFSVQTK